MRRKTLVDDSDGFVWAGKAYELRDACLREYRQGRAYAEQDPDFDPGDSEVDIDGQGHNVLRVLWILKSLGVPDCEVK